MAISGFADGALAGFGAVNKFYGDREDRRLRQQQQDDMTQYRADTIGLQRDQLAETVRKNTLADKQSSRTLGIQEQNATTAATNATTAEINARAAEIRAKTAADEADAINKTRNEKTGLTAEQQAAVDLRNAQADEKKEIARKTKLINDKIAAAQVLDEINTLLREGPLTPEASARLTELVQQSRDYGGYMDVGRLVSKHKEEASVTINTLLQNVATNGSTPLTRREIDSIGTTLGLDNSKYVGLIINDNFVNAPDRLKDGNHEVVRSGLFNVQASAADSGNPQAQTTGELSFTGRMYVLTRNRKTGEIEPYFAPLTEFRDPTSGKGLNLVIGAFGDTHFGQEHMRQSLMANPSFQESVKAALISNKYGNDSDPSGNVRFDKQVDEVLAQIEKNRENGTGELIMETGYILEGEDPILMAENNVATLRARIEDRKLGIDAPSVRLVDNWLEQNREALAAFPLSGTVISTNGSLRDRGGIVSKTLGEKLTDLQSRDTADPNMITRLSSLFDPPRNENEPPRLRVSMEEFKRILSEEYSVEFDSTKQLWSR